MSEKPSYEIAVVSEDLKESRQRLQNALFGLADQFNGLALDLTKRQSSINRRLQKIEQAGGPKLLS